MSLRMQAENFFNAFKVLEANSKLFMQRLSNDQSSQEKQIEEFGIRPTMGVEVVCLAFSVELYIKDVHLTVSGEALRGHNILTLFERLPEKQQQDIFYHPSIKRYGWSFEDFKLEIKQISDGFERWRYYHESVSIRYNHYFAFVFLEALISIAASIRKTQRQNNGKG